MWDKVNHGKYWETDVDPSYWGFDDSDCWACKTRWAFGNLSGRRSESAAKETGKGMLGDSFVLTFKSRLACETYFTKSSLGFSAVGLALAIILAVLGLGAGPLDYFVFQRSMKSEKEKFRYLLQKDEDSAMVERTWINRRGGLERFFCCYDGFWHPRPEDPSGKVHPDELRGGKPIKDQLPVGARVRVQDEAAVIASLRKREAVRRKSALFGQRFSGRFKGTLSDEERAACGGGMVYPVAQHNLMKKTVELVIRVPSAANPEETILSFPTSACVIADELAVATHARADERLQPGTRVTILDASSVELIMYAFNRSARQARRVHSRSRGAGRHLVVSSRSSAVVVLRLLRATGRPRNIRVAPRGVAAIRPAIWRARRPGTARGKTLALRRVASGARERRSRAASAQAAKFRFPTTCARYVVAHTRS